MAELIPVPKIQFFDANGNPLPGGKIYSYASGTMTTLATYADAAALVPNPNPVVLDAGGWATIFLGPSNYTIQVKTAAEVTVYTQDNVRTPAQLLQLSLSAPGGSAMVGFLQAGTGAVERTSQDKLRERVSVTDFGALPNGVDCHVQIQKAIDYATTNGVKELFFPAGVAFGTAAASSQYYNLGSTTLNIHTGSLKVTASKFAKLKKTGAGAFFRIADLTEGHGYGLEFENLYLEGDGSNNQIGFHFVGTDIAVGFMIGVSVGSIHDCFFNLVGKKETADETAGGAVLIESDCNTFKLEHNFCANGGYLLRHNVGGDNCQVRHNLCAVSKSMSVQIVDITGSGIYEISGNVFANVGGGIWIKNGAHVNIFGNEFVPGESGSLGNLVKRDYESISLAENAAGSSALLAVRACFGLKVHENTFSLSTGGGAPVPGDDGIYLSVNQAVGQIYNNGIFGYSRYGIRNFPFQMTYVNNIFDSAVPGSQPYSESIKPGILHYGHTTGHWSIGRDSTTSSFEVASDFNIYPPMKISDYITPGKWVGLGYSNTHLAAYIALTGAGAGLLGTNTSPYVDGNKNFLWGIPHFTGTTNAFFWAVTGTTPTDNAVAIGGGSSLGTAATSIEFYTAANPSTLVGTRRFRITQEGYLVVDSLPTSATGLPSGALWNDAGTVKIVP